METSTLLFLNSFKRALVLSPRKIVESNNVRTTTAVDVSSLLIEKRFDVSWCLATGAPSLCHPWRSNLMPFLLESLCSVSNKFVSERKNGRFSKTYIHKALYCFIFLVDCHSSSHQRCTEFSASCLSHDLSCLLHCMVIVSKLLSWKRIIILPYCTNYSFLSKLSQRDSINLDSFHLRFTFQDSSCFVLDPAHDGHSTALWNASTIQ
jgi:hypothetical protein